LITVKIHRQYLFPGEEVLRWLGVLYSHASGFDGPGKANRAVETCRKAIRLNPDDPAGYYFLAIKSNPSIG
jgi:hypothetical protein